MKNKKNAGPPHKAQQCAKMVTARSKVVVRTGSREQNRNIKYAFNMILFKMGR